MRIMVKHTFKHSDSEIILILNRRKVENIFRLDIGTLTSNAPAFGGFTNALFSMRNGVKLSNRFRKDNITSRLILSQCVLYAMF